MATPRILRRGDVLRLTRLSKATINRQIKAGNFPAPVKLSIRAVGWYEDEVVEWMEGRPRAGPETSS